MVFDCLLTYQRTWLVSLYNYYIVFALLEEMHDTTWIIIDCTANGMHIVCITVWV